MSAQWNQDEQIQQNLFGNVLGQQQKQDAQIQNKIAGQQQNVDSSVQNQLNQDQQNQQAALAQAQKAQTQQDSQIQSSIAGQQQNVDSSVQNQLNQDQQNQQNILNKNQGRHLLKVCLPLQASCQVWRLRMHNPTLALIWTFSTNAHSGMLAFRHDASVCSNSTQQLRAKAHNPNPICNVADHIAMLMSCWLLQGGFDKEAVLKAIFGDRLA